jgi:hypothetical protein
LRIVEEVPASSEIDALLAAAVEGRSATYPADWRDATQQVLSRIFYNGTAGLLQDNAARLDTWPSTVLEGIREEALARAMWELGHRAVISGLLAALAAEGVSTLLLKGTALAYDLYSKPQLRQRGDTDLLVEDGALDSAREILAKGGFQLAPEFDLPPELQSQETWVFCGADGGEHAVDLHWRALNAPFLSGAMTFAELAEGRRPLPRLSPFAFAPDRPSLLFHTCLHRALHNCVPYNVAGEAYFGGNRLIWLNDIALLGRALAPSEWRRFADAAVERGFAATCIDGLKAAEACFGKVVPDDARSRLEHSRGRQDRYLQANQLRRAAMDAAAVSGTRNKLRYLLARAIPAPAFMRSKYPDMSDRSLARLYGRRFIELLHRRPSETSG